ncbi:MAG: FN3 associated domain-containing protein [Algoriphagus sp.]|nr:FN3 associated domain-containing protein [Algoriphagus sp.]
MLKISKIISLLENALFAWLGLAFIFIIAGSGILLPDWLQLVGRTHPLLLHFPIVLLLLGLIFFWIPGIRDKKEIREIGDLSFLAGINFAGLTVVAGLILAQEEYEGDALFWHQWVGIGIFVLSVGIYFLRDRSFRALKPLTLALVAGIFITGHLGANLTHGEDFLLAPIKSAEVELVAMSEAEIFRDMVQPILEAKCQSCHKEGKIKGELRMDYLEGLKKGGKSGPFVIAGDFENSLLIQRINLPGDDKKHMPPKNKPQLTDEEIEILMEWVASGASFEQKVEEADPKSELFQLASLKFNSAKAYTFDPADPDEVEELNNFFRKVQPIYPESPALVVSYFGISAFDPASLNDFKKVKNQIVKLNLNKMPLAGVDLKFLSELSNLEELQLNFTDLDSKQLENLVSLENLRSLALSGNQLDPESLEDLVKIKNLQKLYLWQSGLDDAQKEKLKTALPQTKIDFGYDGRGVIYALNSPKIELEKVLFKDSIELIISHPIKTAEIRYTLDGSEPDSISSPVFKESIWLKKTEKIKAKSFAPDWKRSPSIEALVMKSGITPTDLNLKTQPNEKYKAQGAATLFDQIKGKNNHGSGEWLGYQDQPLDLEFSIENGKAPKELALSLFYNEGSHIFPPAKVEIWTFSQGKWISVINEVPTQSEKEKESRPEVLEYALGTNPLEKIRVRISPISKLPNWHPSAGSKGWIFIDEILLN